MRCLARHQLVQRVLRQWEAQVAMRCLARLGPSPRTVGGHQQNEQKALPSKFLGHQLVQRVLRQWEAQVAIRCLARPGPSPRPHGRWNVCISRCHMYTKAIRRPRSRSICQGSKSSVPNAWDQGTELDSVGWPTTPVSPKHLTWLGWTTNQSHSILLNSAHGLDLKERALFNPDLQFMVHIASLSTAYQGYEPQSDLNATIGQSYECRPLAALPKW
jgi:hypothetical protein